MLQSVYSFSSSSLSVVQVGTLHIFLDQWKSFTSSRFVFSTVTVQHHQLGCHSPLFCNFKQFNFKAARAYHPIIKKGVNGLLAKDSIKPFTGVDGFYPSAFLFPKYTGSLQPIFSLKDFNYCVHKQTFRILTIRQVLQLIQKEDYVFFH